MGVADLLKKHRGVVYGAIFVVVVPLISLWYTRRGTLAAEQGAEEAKKSREVAEAANRPVIVPTLTPSDLRVAGPMVFLADIVSLANQGASVAENVSYGVSVSIEGDSSGSMAHACEGNYPAGSILPGQVFTPMRKTMRMMPAPNPYRVNGFVCVRYSIPDENGSPQWFSTKLAFRLVTARGSFFELKETNIPQDDLRFAPANDLYSDFQ